MNGRACRCTVFPAGTENLVAQHFGLRTRPGQSWPGRSPPDASARLSTSAQAAGRRFLLMAGFGFDGDIVTRHHQGRRLDARARSGRPIGWPTSGRSCARASPTDSRRSRCGSSTPALQEILTGTTVFVFNAPRYALGLPFVPTARDDDGWLDLIVFREPGPFQAFYYLWKVFRGTHLDDPSVFHRRVRKVVVTSDGVADSRPDRRRSRRLSVPVPRPPAVPEIPAGVPVTSSPIKFRPPRPSTRSAASVWRVRDPFAEAVLVYAGRAETARFQRRSARQRRSRTIRSARANRGESEHDGTADARRGTRGSKEATDGPSQPGHDRPDSRSARIARWP